MRVGVYLHYQNTDDWPRFLDKSDAPPQRTDQEIIDEELALADLVEPLGFDSYWAVDHYGSPYAMTGGVLQHLTHIAGRTKRIDVGTMVLVLPWYDPVQVAHQISVLDNMLQGRKLTLCVGRGAAVREFDSFRIPMADARSRYKESLDVIRLALSQEWFEYDGERFKIPPTTVRPRFRNPQWILDNMKAAWSSAESLPLAAHAGLGLLLTNQRSWQEYRQEVIDFNAIRAEHGWEPVQPTVTIRVSCFEDEAQAWDVMERYNLQAQHSSTLHYQLDDVERFLNTPGYEQYAKMAAKAPTDEQITAATARPQAWGTPDQVFQRLMDIRERTKAAEFVVLFRFGAMPAELAEQSMRLFAKEVLPRVHAVEAKMDLTDDPGLDVPVVSNV
ncbi:MAG: LLM class flavin-dependent oxidoreductase [Ilumatobacteraceae bacterium]|jgi:alkanesulfonate monooxygenase SsuD/methylene tetrahydromethanopterin reductase-like flavin-dependent oxidoreductase (luciferase family)